VCGCVRGVVNAVASSVCSRHDPHVLRHEVAVRKRHVEQLRREMNSMESEMATTQHGLSALSKYDPHSHSTFIVVIVFFHLHHLIVHRFKDLGRSVSPPTLISVGH